MSAALDRQLAAYYRERAQILQDNKEGWALVAREALVSVFDEFETAAQYADEHYPDEQVLIRHTAEQRGVAPFIVSKRQLP
jgi:hypothetical protein